MLIIHRNKQMVLMRWKDGNVQVSFPAVYWYQKIPQKAGGNDRPDQKL